MKNNNNLNRPETYRAEDFDEYLRRLGHGPKTRPKELKRVSDFTGWLTVENTPLHEAGHNDIMAYIGSRSHSGNSPATLAAKTRSIKHYYDFLCGENELTDNPASNIEIKGIKRIRLHHTYTPEGLENIYRTFRDTIPEEANQTSRLAHLRDCCIVRLCIKQGLTAEETGRLTVTDIVPSEGKINIPGTRRSNPRKLSLEAAQLHELTGYIYDTRPKLLALSAAASTALFFPLRGGDGFNNVAHAIIAKLKKQNPGLTDIKQVRNSVISNWLKTHNLRKVQYMAGHRYVSSTERYKANNMEELIDEIERYHPLG